MKLAAYRMEQGDMDTALSMVEAGLESGSSNVRQELLACEVAIYEEKRDFQTAKEKMEAYLAEYPEDEEAARDYTFLKTR